MWDNTSLSNEDTVDRVSGEGIIKARAVLFKNSVKIIYFIFVRGKKHRSFIFKSPPPLLLALPLLQNPSHEGCN